MEEFEGALWSRVHLGAPSDSLFRLGLEKSTFLRVSVSVSVPVDLELTGLKVPSTLSSRRIFKGDGGMAPETDIFPDLPVTELDEVTTADWGVDDIVDDIISSIRLLKIKKNGQIFNVF